MTEASVRTTCPYCGVGCGVIATPDGKGGAAVAGDAEHPANFGRLCSKGSALGETLDLGTRLLHPMIGGARVSWDAALDHIATGFKNIIATDGPDAVAFYLSGQLLSEDYYVANKLMKGFIGSANVDTNSRLCMSSSVSGHKRAFGSDTVPGCYADIDEADLFVLVGSNAAWCHPVLYQRMVAAQEKRGAKLINIDPRVTATSEAAFLHLALAQGQDGTLFSGLLVFLADHGYLDRAFIAAHTEGFDEALFCAREIAPNLTVTASRTRLPIESIKQFYELWATTERVITFYSQGVNQSVQGTDKVVAILNCHLAAGRIGRPGMGPFSLTGQPNAMGGREVGGLANQLAAHMGFSHDDINLVQRFWRAPRMATHEGLKAVDLFEAIDRGKVKALWIIGTNPAVSLPEADFVVRALGELDLCVISENVVSNDTVRAAHGVLLPAAAWGEKDGTVTNSERRISRQRTFMQPAGEARPDWWAVSEVAKRLGFQGFDYPDVSAIFAEHAALSAFENNGSRDFDLGGLAHLSKADYDKMLPVQWPCPAKSSVGRQRLFADGQFFTPTAKARFQEIASPRLAELPSAQWPLLLNTGRVRDQWHTMTRTGLSLRLASHISEPFIAVHPLDAAAAGLSDGCLAEIKNAHGRALLRVSVTSSQEHGAVFAPIHWNGETAGAARVGSLVHRIVDPLSGQPDAKATPVAIRLCSMARGGFIVARKRFALPENTYWAWQAIEGGFAALIETNAPDAAFENLLRSDPALGEVEELYLSDPKCGVFRYAQLYEKRAETVLFLSTLLDAPRWTVVQKSFAAGELDAMSRKFLLSGRGLDGAVDEGPTVCACFGVPHDRIQHAIENGAVSLAPLQSKLKAGTNCGSCVPELKRLLAAYHEAHALALT
jgi:assimilatory nitrate reductase catalytic subunit